MEMDEQVLVPMEVRLASGNRPTRSSGGNWAKSLRKVVCPRRVAHLTMNNPHTTAAMMPTVAEVIAKVSMSS